MGSTKWADAIPLPDQSAFTITTALINLFSAMGMPDVVHSDQGRNFESTMLKQSLEAFGIAKSRTTAYHPEGDGMVERFNRSLLQLLRVYVDTQSDWEKHLPLALYAYCTAVHSSTGVSPHFLMFGRPPHSPLFASSPCSFDPTPYQFHLRDQLAKLRDLVESNLVASSAAQKNYYDNKSSLRTFSVNDCVWLSVPVAGKLEPKWEGGWRVTSVLSPVTIAISDGKRNRVVHINRLQRRIQPMETDGLMADSPSVPQWRPPEVDHFFVEETSTEPQPEPQPRRYPSRTRRQPDFKIFLLISAHW